MRDGVKLATEVYRPTRAGKYPVILQRSPYNRMLALPTTSGKSCTQDVPAPDMGVPTLRALAERGYVAVRQEVRGTYRSEGKFRPSVQEGDDGFDAVEWAARQPWSTGKVGMMGGSYLGMTQWQAALKRPPHLVTIVPSVARTSLHKWWPYQTGGLYQLSAQRWTAIMAKDQLWRKLTAAHIPPAEIEAQANAYYDRLMQSADSLPLAGNPLFNNSELTPWYNIWLSRSTLDSYREPGTANDEYQTLSIPVLSLGAFYDLFIAGTVEGFTGLQQRAATPQARAAARLIIAGGGHAGGSNNYVGDLTFGAENMLPVETVFRWFDYWLKGIDNGVMNDPAVTLYVMLPPDQGSVGSGFWVTGSSFPLPGTQTVRYYLGGNRASSIGGGILSLTPTANPGSDQYRYDPANPVPTIGGNITGDPAMPAGAFDQRPVERRKDVLVYTSERLAKAIPVVGDVTVTLTASSSAPSTAFSAKLVDVHLDGYAQNIADGIAVVRSESSGRSGKYTIRLGPTATIFKPGHRIRLEISSSNYPRFNAHTNTDAPLEKAMDLAVATQTIMWQGTSLNLPVAPISVPANGAP
jgi:putative CocE/NonD family hydrolase